MALIKKEGHEFVYMANYPIYYDMGDWKEWNKRIFNCKEMNASSFQNKVEATIVEVVNIRVSRINPNKLEFMEWDMKLRTRWFGLKILEFGSQEVVGQ